MGRLDYAIAFLVGGGVLAGIGWLVSRLPLVEVGDSAGLALFIVGGVITTALYAILTRGWREALGPWASWLKFMAFLWLPLVLAGGLVGWYMRNNADKPLVIWLTDEVPTKVWVILLISVVVAVVAGMYGWAIYKYNRERRSSGD